MALSEEGKKIKKTVMDQCEEICLHTLKVIKKLRSDKITTIERECLKCWLQCWRVTAKQSFDQYLFFKSLEDN